MRGISLLHAHAEETRSHFYSIVDAVAIRTIVAEVTTPSVHCDPKILSAPLVLADNERFVIAAPVVTFRSNCVGSIFGDVDIWNIGASGEPSNWYKLR